MSTFRKIMYCARVNTPYAKYLNVSTSNTILMDFKRFWFLSEKYTYNVILRSCVIFKNMTKPNVCPFPGTKTYDEKMCVKFVLKIHK